MSATSLLGCKSYVSTIFPACLLMAIRARLCRPDEGTLEIEFDDFEQATQQLQQRLGASTGQSPPWHPHPNASDSHREVKAGASTSAEQRIIKAAPDHHGVYQISRPQAQYEASDETGMSAFSSETQALLRQIQAVKL